jgi:hypothetical protein
LAVDSCMQALFDKLVCLPLTGGKSAPWQIYETMYSALHRGWDTDSGICPVGPQTQHLVEEKRLGLFSVTLSYIEQHL